MRTGNSIVPRAKITLLAATVMAVCGYSAAWGQPGDGAAPFELGAVVVNGVRPQVGEIGEDQVASVITRKGLRQGAGR